MLTSQLKSGDKFDTLQKTISIIITDFTMINDNRKYHYTFELLDMETGAKFTDLIEIHTLELTKIPNESDNTAKYDWLRFLKSEKEVMMSENPMIQKAAAVLKELSRSERAQMIYEDRMKAIRDEKARLKTAVNKVRMPIIAKMLKRGDSIDEIADFLDLTVEEVENTKKKLEL